jgi:hypothetical protein
LNAQPPLVSVIVPVYNEERTVAAVIARLLTIDLPAPREIIAVNDGSLDNTAALLDGLAGTPSLTIIHADRNRGKGHAIRLGLAHARGTIIAIQDADLELDPAQLADLVTPILAGETAVVYGSRFLNGRGSSPWLNWLANRVLTGFTNALHGSSLTDMETCYKIMRTDVARNLGLTADRFDIEPEITARLLLGGHTIVERPVSFSPRSRAAGKKIGWRDGVIALRVLFRLRPRGALITRSLVLILLAALSATCVMLLSGGFELRLGGRLVRSHSSLPWIGLTALDAALLVLRGPASLKAAFAWGWAMAAKCAAALASGLALATIMTGWLAGTHVAGGSDSYCYLTQAEMLARGQVREVQPLAVDAPWANATWAFTPAGYMAAPASAAIVPICPAGYPLLMALARIPSVFPVRDVGGAWLQALRRKEPALHPDLGPSNGAQPPDQNLRSSALRPLYGGISGPDVVRVDEGQTLS